MNKPQKTITFLNSLLLLFVLLVYGFLRFKFFFISEQVLGDESVFLNIFRMYLEEGFYNTSVYGNSILFNFFSSIIYFFVKNPLLSIRTTSLISGIFCLFFILKTLKLKKDFSLFQKTTIFLTCLNVAIIPSIFISGYNDSLLYLITVVFFYNLEKYSLLDHRFKYIFNFVFFLVASILTRNLGILYIIPAFFIFIINHYLLIKKKRINFLLENSAVLIISSIFFVSIINYPSLKENRTISMTSKEPQGRNVSWTQRQYLSAIYVSQGKLQDEQHVTWDETEKFIINNGRESLPTSFLETITLNPYFKIKKTIFNFFYQIKPITRLLGLLFFVFFGVALFKYKLALKLLKADNQLLFFFVYLAILCVVVFNNIEPRWYLNVLILLPISFFSLFNKLEISKIKWFNFVLLNTQIIFLTIINIPYIIKNI
jgi:hypothetical protein